MNKPTKITRNPVYDYHEVIRYIENKYNIDTRDYANSHKHIYKWISETGNNYPSCPNANSPEYKEGLQKYYDDCTKYATWCKENPKPPYLDFWHWLLDNDFDGIHNGCSATLDIKFWLDELNEDEWQREILQLIFNEFQENEMKFWIEW